MITAPADGEATMIWEGKNKVTMIWEAEDKEGRWDGIGRVMTPRMEGCGARRRGRREHLVVVVGVGEAWRVR